MVIEFAFLYSYKTLHEALKLSLVNPTVAIIVDFVEEGIYHSIIELLSETDLSECSSCKWHHLFAV